MWREGRDTENRHQYTWGLLRETQARVKGWPEAQLPLDRHCRSALHRHQSQTSKHKVSWEEAPAHWGPGSSCRAGRMLAELAGGVPLCAWGMPEPCQHFPADIAEALGIFSFHIPERYQREGVGEGALLDANPGVGTTEEH